MLEAERNLAETARKAHEADLKNKADVGAIHVDILTLGFNMAFSVRNCIITRL